MAEEIKPTGQGEGRFANADYTIYDGYDPKKSSFEELKDYTVNVTTDFKVGDGVIPAGSYKIVDQKYAEGSTTKDGFGALPVVTLEAADGKQYQVPNHFIPGQTVATEIGDKKFDTHPSYVDLWANSYTTGGKDQAAPTGVTATLREADNPGAKDIGYNTYKETVVASQSPYGDNVELGLETRKAGEVTGQKVSVDGKIMDAPYRTGEVIIGKDEKAYQVETYTEQTEDGYKIVLKPLDGGESVETTTKDLIDGEYRVVTSAIEKGSEFGYHADEAKVQADFKAQREGDTYKVSDTAMSIDAMKAGKQSGNIYGRVTTADGKEVDAVVQFTGDGKDPVVIDKKTGEVLTGVKDSVKVYELQDDDHNALAHSYLTGGTEAGNKAYGVTSIITDRGIERGEYKAGDGWFYDPYTAVGAVDPKGTVATSREKSEVYDEAMWGHHLTEHASLPDLMGGTTYANPQAAIAALVGTKHWTRQDATIFVNDAIASGLITVQAGFAEKEAYYPPYVGVHSEFKGEGSLYGARAATLTSEVEVLVNDTNALLYSMDGWSGKASKSAQKHISLVQGRLFQTANNIQERLIPACNAINELDGKLSDLEREDTVLKALLEDREAKATAMETAKKAYDDAPEPKKVEKEKEDGTKYTVTEHENDKANALAAYNTAKSEWKEADKLVKDQQKKECDMEQEILGLIETVKSLDANMASLGDHVSQDGKMHEFYADPGTFDDNYERLMQDFQSTDRFPVLTSLSDYKLGDLITLDDSYGYLYKVVEIFDGDGHATGSIKIVRVDKDGNPIPGSSVLTIHDQREISPIRGPEGRRLWEPPITVVPSTPPTTEPPTTEPIATKPPGGPTGGPPTSEPPTTQPPTTKPPTTKPPTTSQPPTTKPPTTKPPTTSQPPTTMPIITDIPIPSPGPDPTRIPDPDLPTAPTPTYIDDPDVPYIPHTGIDGVVTGGDQTQVKQSGAGAVGALAGIMAGAAGLGLTTLAGDKEEKEEKKEKEEKEREEQEQQPIQQEYNPYM